MSGKMLNVVAGTVVLAAGAPVISADTSGKAIDKDITYIRTAGKNVQERIHTCVVAIISHAQQYGDCSRALKLVLAMPKGMRRSLVVKAFGMFSPIAVTVNDTDAKKNSVRLRSTDSKKYTKFNVAGAKLTPWYKIEPEPMEDNSWDEAKVTSVVINLADRLQKRLDDGKIEADAVAGTRAKIAALRAA